MCEKKSTWSGIYMFSLGRVGELRKELDIGDEYKDNIALVARCGASTNVYKRINEYVASYNIGNVRLEAFAWVDPSVIMAAEKYVFETVEKYRYEHDRYQDLLILPQNKSGSISKDIHEIGRDVR